MAKCKARRYCPVHNPSPKDKKRQADEAAGKRLLIRIRAIQTGMSKTKSPVRVRRALANFEKLMPEMRRLAPKMARIWTPFLRAAKKQLAA